MTRDEILNMPAGREMDYLIAEKVLELPALKDSSSGILLPLDVQVRFYSTDIAAAWQVVEASHIYIHTLRRIVNDLPDSPALWQALIYADTYKAGCGETAPLAICRAALLATLEKA